MRKRSERATHSVDRREFLAGTGAFAGLGLLSISAYASEPARTLVGSVRARHAPQRAVFQQMPYFSFDGTGERYERPSASAATRDYLNGIDHEEYLRRHWFT